MTSQPASLATRVHALECTTTELAVIIAGTPRPQIAGGGRNPDGLTHKVETLQQGMDRIEKVLHNGGMRTRLSGGQKVALWVASIGSMGAIIAAAVAAVVGG
ncbi:MAG: hypothetical protein V2A79_01915 [Planctomycetota bacterium]